MRKNRIYTAGVGQTKDWLKCGVLGSCVQSGLASICSMCWEEQCCDGGKGGIWWNRLGTGPQVEKVKSLRARS